MCALMKSATYRITSAGAELPSGSQFNVKRGPVKRGDLCLFKVRDLLIVGRWIPNAAGCDWIIQPGKWIRLTAPARILGAVNLTKGGRDIDHTN